MINVLFIEIVVLLDSLKSTAFDLDDALTNIKLSWLLEILNKCTTCCNLNTSNSKYTYILLEFPIATTSRKGL